MQSEQPLEVINYYCMGFHVNLKGPSHQIRFAENGTYGRPYWEQMTPD